MLRLDRTTLRWTWDSAAVRARELTDTVLELLLGRLRTLPPQTQRCLSVAACLGSTPSVAVLLALEDAASLLESLRQLVSEGLLVTAADLWSLERLVPELGIAFVHDRVQQAAYALLADAERPAMLGPPIVRRPETTQGEGRQRRKSPAGHAARSGNELFLLEGVARLAQAGTRRPSAGPVAMATARPHRSRGAEPVALSSAAARPPPPGDNVATGPGSRLEKPRREHRGQAGRISPLQWEPAQRSPRRQPTSLFLLGLARARAPRVHGQPVRDSARALVAAFPVHTGVPDSEAARECP